jgi:hypothetical protein
MQRQADALVSSLRDFIAQSDYPTLVLNGADPAIVFASRGLSALDRQDDAAYYLLFPEPCTDAVAYMSAVARRLTDELEVFNAELAARKMPPLPPFPVEVSDGRYPPAKRLRAAIDHCDAHLPGGAPIAWGLLPAELTDLRGYRAMIGQLLATEAIEPWMDRHRFIVRDQQPPSSLTQELLVAKNDRVLVLDLDFSNEAYVQGLVETAQDRGLPPDDRMNAFFQLAIVDFALKRYPEALQKYGVCFNYFETRKNEPMQALCLSGAGDTMREAGRPADALKFYQQSLAVAIESKNLPVTHNGLYGAGSMCLDLERSDEARGYLQLASEAAGKLQNPYAKCDAMEKLGLALWRLGKVQESVDTWIKAKELAKQFSYAERAASILSYLIALSRAASLHHRVAELERERTALGVAESGTS